MNNDNYERIIDYLESINPSALDYEQWVQVGMGIASEGLPFDVWDSWSSCDARHKPAEMQSKWKSFHDHSNGVTGGTIHQLAIDQGWKPKEKVYKAFSMDAMFTMDDCKIIDKEWVQKLNFPTPNDAEYDDVLKKNHMIKYLETLFEPDDYVGISNSYEKDGNHYPGTSKKYKVEHLITNLTNSIKYESAIGETSKHYWIRCNPMDDSNDSKDSNVEKYKYALVESDDMPVNEQYSMLTELELPIATLTHSGGKSLHALIKIDARDKHEYKERVNQLLEICQKNGYSADRKNRNPSRLTRLAGVMRGDQKQFLIDTNIGKENFVEWHDWVKELNDELPDFEIFDDDIEIEEKSEELIEGVLREGMKMMLAAPSKAGKSFSLIQLAIAIASGTKWLGEFQCKKGKILYINMEINKASAKHRIKDTYTELKLKRNKNLHIWNLRGENTLVSNLIPKLIRRAKEMGFKAIIIDPLYKMLEGDESDARAMTQFGMMLDKACNELGCALIFCHHHSKGGQGEKSSMDRASGSGVLSRDPDAILDMIELDFEKWTIYTLPVNDAADYAKALFIGQPAYDFLTNDILLSFHKLKQFVRKYGSYELEGQLIQIHEDEVDLANEATAWRVSGTLREFKGFDNKNIWFKYPIHVPDELGILLEAEIKGAPKTFGKPKKITTPNFVDKKEPQTRVFKAFKENLAKAISLKQGSIGVDEFIKLSNKAPTENEKAIIIQMIDRTIDFSITNDRIHSNTLEQI